MNAISPIQVAFSTMCKPVGSRCNLSCDYCYYLEKETSALPKMKPEILENFIQQYISSQSTPSVQFVWHGGEPTLLGIEYFKQIINLQQKHANNRSIQNVLQTNGTLLDDAWGNFLHDNNFLVGISIDGKQHNHDHFRLNLNKNSTFDKTLNGIKILQKHQVDFNTLSVVNSYNAGLAAETYHFLKSLGVEYMQFTPVVERTRGNLLAGWDHSKQDVTSYSVSPEDYGRFLCELFDEWAIADIGKVFIPTFDSILANIMGMPPALCVHAETCGHASVLSQNGDLYSCDHFVFKDFYLGNIMQNSLLKMMYSPQQIAFGQAKKKLNPQKCFQCKFWELCFGECPRNRFTFTNDGEQNLNYLCKGLFKFFEHSFPFFEMMAEKLQKKLPPAEIMPKVRAILNKLPQNPNLLKQKCKPSEPCPCGSGLKYKNCCRNK